MQPIRTHATATAPSRAFPALRAVPRAASTPYAVTVMEISDEEGALWDAYARTRPGFETIG